MPEIQLIEYVVEDKKTGESWKADQRQIVYGQRVIGYIGNQEGAQPLLVVHDLPDSIIADITSKCGAPPKQAPRIQPKK